MRKALLVVILLVVAASLYWYWQNQPEDLEQQAPVDQSQVRPDSMQSDAMGEGEKDVVGSPHKQTQAASNKAIKPGTDSSQTEHISTPESEKNVTEKDARDGVFIDEIPAIDIVRVDKSGSLLIAGKARPNSNVKILFDNREQGEITSDNRGEFVYLSDKPLENGDYQISLQSESKQGEDLKSDELAIVSVRRSGTANDQNTTAAFITHNEPGGDVKILQATRQSQTAEPKTQRQSSSAPPQGMMQALSIDQLDYTDDGKVRISGRGEGGYSIRLYLDNQFQSEGRITDQGQWQFELELLVRDKLYTLRVDQLDDEGVVIARAEIPYKPALAPKVDEKNRLVIVQPGNSLWRISRHVYGKGLQYTVIYEANRTQIVNPDLIYPGQVFQIPKSGE